MIFTAITPIQPMEKMDFSQPAEQLASTSQQTGGFSQILQNAVNDLEALQQQTAEDTLNIALGDIDNLAQVQINSMKASTMLQTTVQLTSRAVNAYKEIMQMQV